MNSVFFTFAGFARGVADAEAEVGGVFLAEEFDECAFADAAGAGYYYGAGVGCGHGSVWNGECICVD